MLLSCHAYLIKPQHETHLDNARCGLVFGIKAQQIRRCCSGEHVVQVHVVELLRSELLQCRHCCLDLVIGSGHHVVVDTGNGQLHNDQDKEHGIEAKECHAGKGIEEGSKLDPDASERVGVCVVSQVGLHVACVCRLLLKDGHRLIKEGSGLLLIKHHRFLLALEHPNVRPLHNSTSCIRRKGSIKAQPIIPI